MRFCAMHPWSPARVFIRNGWLAVLLFAVAGCFGPPERELYEGDFPWLYIGVSCEERSYYSGIPICPHGEPDNIVYSGWILHGGENTDGQCGNLDRQPYGAVLALDVFLNPGLIHSSYYDAAECVLQHTKSKIIHCEEDWGKCASLYSFEFQSRAAMKIVIPDCMLNHPPTNH